MRALAAALLLTAAATILVSPNPAPRPEALYRKARALLWDGEFDKAATSAHIGPQPSEWLWRFRLLEAEALIEGGKPDAGLALLSAGSTASAEFEIRRRSLTARRLITLAKFDPARALLTEARQLAVLHSRPDLEPEIDLLLGQLCGRQQQFAAAETAFANARRSAQAAGDQFHLASSLNNLGVLRLHQYRWDEAVPLFAQAEKLFVNAGAWHYARAAANNLVICYSRLGDFDKALAYRQERVRLTHPSILRSNALGETGMTYYLQQEPAKALPYLRQARDMAVQFGAPGVASLWAGNLSAALAETGDWDAAEKALQEARDLGPEPRSRIFLDLDAAFIAERRKRLPEARTIYQKALATEPDNPGVQWVAYAGIAKTAGSDVELANRSFEAALRVIERSQSSLAGNDNQMKFLARLIGFYQDYVDALMTRNQPVQALAVADGSRARVLSQRFGRSLHEAATPREAEDFKTIARQSGSVWLSYWLAPNRSLLWVTTPKEIRVFQLTASSSEIAGLVEEYRGFVESMRDPLQVENEAGRRLYEILIAPAASMIPPGARVIVVPDGPLHQLAFETLPVCEGPHPHYWVEDAAVSIAPSFGVFRTGRAPTGTGRKTLLIGDAVSPGPGFPRLEYAAGEIATVERRLAPGVDKAVREDARPAVWRQRDPGRFDIIHFAAHAEANRRSPLDSAIILSPDNGFRLYARDIIDASLRAGLVTLSACRSSGARTYAGEGLVGLTWAFLQAGSHNVVAGLWDVADESTSRLMDRFYTGIAAAVEPAEALRSAQLALLHTEYAKPYYWGPFQCYRR